MIKNAAFLAALIVFGLVLGLGSQLDVLAPYKHVIFPRYVGVVIAAVVILFFNVFAVVFLLARSLFLKDTGRKLAHVEKQLRTGDSVIRDLTDRLAKEE